MELFPIILSAISVHTGPAVVRYLGIHTQKTDLFPPYPRLRYQLYGEFHPPPPLTTSLQVKSGPLRAVFSLTFAGNSSLFHACSYCMGTQMYQSERKTATYSSSERPIYAKLSVSCFIYISIFRHGSQQTELRRCNAHFALFS